VHLPGQEEHEADDEVIVSVALVFPAAAFYFSPV
jgi:hypothetical protein